jgi:putative hydrolase of the HAD superfamily
VTIRAVAFDIGGVLERVDDSPVTLIRKWRQLLGMSEAEFDAAMARVDPDDLIRTGGLTEAEFSQRYADVLQLSPAQAHEFMTDLWNWYCGELDVELIAFAASLRPRVATAILSNSADGARREELARYSFDEIFDLIIYSHEVGLAKPDPAIFTLTCARLSVAPDELIFVDDVPGHVEAARRLGIHAIVHTGTPRTIAEITALLGS